MILYDLQTQTVFANVQLPTVLVVLTTLAGYSMAPVSINVSTLLWMTAGTSLCSGAANTFNQVRLYNYKRTSRGITVHDLLLIQ